MDIDSRPPSTVRPRGPRRRQRRLKPTHGSARWHGNGAPEPEGVGFLIHASSSVSNAPAHRAGTVPRPRCRTFRNIRLLLHGRTEEGAAERPQPAAIPPHHLRHQDEEMSPTWLHNGDGGAEIGPDGFEPSLPDPKTGVLPLDDGPIPKIFVPPPNERATSRFAEHQILAALLHAVQGTRR